MLQNQNPQLHNTTLQTGSPPPTVPCPYCPRHLYTKIGRRKHIKVKHPDETNGPNPHVSNVTPPPSPGPSSLHSSSHNVQFERSPSPIPSESTSSPPSRAEVDAADIDADSEYPQFDHQEYIPPDGDALNDDLPPNPIEQHAHNPPQTTYIYHRKLNGKSTSIFTHMPALIITVFRKDLQ
jgi:hypothetical protein